MPLDLTSPRAVKALLGQHGVRPRHRLGQNFLVDRHVIEAILRALEASSADLVMEIGPGLGVLTQALAAVARRVVTVEIDPGMIAVLHQTLFGVSNVDVIEGDALKVDLTRLLSEHLPLGHRALLAANLPYYITTPLLFRLLEEGLPLARIVVMVQREVADRITAKPGGKDYSVLSVAVQNYTEPRLIVHVPRSAFWPAPEVDSAVVALSVRDEPLVTVKHDSFFRVVRAAFGQRRKTLLNSLAAGLHLGKGDITEVLKQAGIDPSRRGETLALDEFRSIAALVALRQTSTQ